MLRDMKADFHAHSADDPRDPLTYSTEMLIDAAAGKGIEVLALTLHESIQVCPRLTRYAERRGILLVPAIEQCVDGRHILILNPDEEQAHTGSFADLRAQGKRDAAFIAPHPYYGLGSCLGRRLLEQIDLFDAIEYCTLYAQGMNWPNRLAVRVSEAHGIPMVGNSDTHALPYTDSTHTVVTAEKTVEGIVDALRAGRVRLVTRPQSWQSLALQVGTVLGHILYFVWWKLREQRHWLPPENLHCFQPGDLHLESGDGAAVPAP